MTAHHVTEHYVGLGSVEAWCSCGWTTAVPSNPGRTRLAIHHHLMQAHETEESA